MKIKNHLMTDNECHDSEKVKLNTELFYYDLTDIINHARFSDRVNGIQRVVLEFGKYISDQDNVKYFYLNPINSKAYSIEGIDFKGIADLQVFKNIWFRNVAEFDFQDLIYLLSRKVEGSQGFTRQLLRLIRKASHFPLVKQLFVRFSKSWLERQFKSNDSVRIKELSNFPKNSAVGIFGGVWNFQKEYNTLYHMNRENAKFILYLHDVIPLVKDSIVPTHLNSVFKGFLKYSVECTDFIVTSAYNNVSDFYQIADKYGYSNDLPKISATGLFYDFGIDKNSVIEHADLRQEVRGMADYNFVLCVGSMEPRKNHFTLLQAWRKFINSDAYNGERLVIAGTWGREVEDLKNSLFYSGHFDGTVTVIEQPSDRELLELYRQCKFNIYPSHYEGWGLPISESMFFGKPIIHMNNSCLSEVSAGAGYVVNDVKEMSEAISGLFQCDELYEKYRGLVLEKQKYLPSVTCILKRITQEINKNV